jgi:hypothetical protein
MGMPLFYLFSDIPRRVNKLIRANIKSMTGLDLRAFSFFRTRSSFFPQLGPSAERGSSLRLGLDCAESKVLSTRNAKFVGDGPLPLEYRKIAGRVVRPHFLGAVVMDQLHTVGVKLVFSSPVTFPLWSLTNIFMSTRRQMSHGNSRILSLRTGPVLQGVDSPT